MLSPSPSFPVKVVHLQKMKCLSASQQPRFHRVFLRSVSFLSQQNTLFPCPNLLLPWFRCNLLAFLRFHHQIHHLILHQIHHLILHHQTPHHLLFPLVLVFHSLVLKVDSSRGLEVALPALAAQLWQFPNSFPPSSDPRPVLVLTCLACSGFPHSHRSRELLFPSVQIP